MNKKVRKSLSMVVTTVMMMNFIEGLEVYAFAAEQTNQVVEATKSDTVVENTTNEVDKDSKDTTEEKTEVAQTKEIGEDELQAALDSINSGNASVEDYTKVGISLVTSDNLNEVNSGLQVEKNSKGENLTIDEIKSYVNKKSEELKTKKTYESISSGQAVLDDYMSLGINSVNADNIDYVNSVIKGSKYTSTAELKTKVDSVANTYNGVNRIYQGKGTIEDYKILSINNIADKVEWINAEVKEKADSSLGKNDIAGKSTSIKNIVNTSLSYYSTVKKINDGKETNTLSNTPSATTDYCIREYADIGAGYMKWNNYIDLLRKAISIGKYSKSRELTKNEILDIVKKAKANPDTRYLEDSLLDVLPKAETEKGSALSAEEAVSIINNRMTAINDSYSKIVSGHGTLDDFSILHIQGATSSNIVWLNAEIRENIDIKLNFETIDGKINNVQNKITTLLGIYTNIRNINDGKETNTLSNTPSATSDYCIAEYRNLGGGNLKWNTYITLLRNAIVIGRFAKDRDLTKQEILSIKTDSINNPDTKYLEKPLLDALNAAEKAKGSKLTAEESLKVIDQRTKEINEAYERIVKGNGSINDYKLIQIAGVESEHVTWLNAEIRENIDINLKFETIDGKINNIQNKITTLLSIYTSIRKINDGKETNTLSNTPSAVSDYCIAEYRSLGGGNLKWDTYITLLRKSISIGRFAKGRDLTKQEILSIKTKTINNADSKFVQQPLLDVLNTAKTKKGSNLTPDESLIIIDKRIQEIDEAYARIVKGIGSIEDYNLIQIAGVKSEHVTWLNAEIRENVDINLKFETIDGKINNIQNKISALLSIYTDIRKINDGNETNTFSNTPSAVSDYCIAEYRNLGGGNLKWNNYITLLRNAISIGRFAKGRDLTKQEILAIKTDSIKNTDTVYLEKPLLDALNAAEKKKGSKLTSEEGLIVIDQRIQEIDEAYERIVNANASLSDYNLLQLKGITSENITWLNAEISENIDINLVFETTKGKINNVQDKLTKILNIYPSIRRINDGNETNTLSNTPSATTDYCIAEIAAIGGSYLKWNDNIDLIRKSIYIARNAKGRDLTKREILSVVSDARLNPDTKYVVIPLRYEIDKVKMQEGFTTDDILCCIDDVLLAIDGSYERIVDGDGTLEDFEYVQIKGVTAGNLQWVNDEIKENIDIKLSFETENGKINNVQNKITSLLGMYNNIKKINDGNETNTLSNTPSATTDYCIAEIAYIGGGYLKWNSNITRIRSKVAAAKSAKGRDLTRQEILAAIK